MSAVTDCFAADTDVPCTATGAIGAANKVRLFWPEQAWEFVTVRTVAKISVAASNQTRLIARPKTRTAIQRNFFHCAICKASHFIGKPWQEIPGVR